MSPARGRTLAAALTVASTLCPIPLFAQQSIGATFTFDDTRHNEVTPPGVALTRHQVFDFDQNSNGGLVGVRIAISLAVTLQNQSIFGSCAGTSDCGGEVDVMQFIHADPVVTIAPGLLNRRVPLRFPGQTSDTALFSATKDCPGETSCTATSLHFGSGLGASATINLDPAEFSVFSGTGTVPIAVDLRVRHDPRCNWQEEDDGIFDFAQWFLGCPTVNSTYSATWTFVVAVTYTNTTTCCDDELVAAPGGPYVGVTGIPVTFDGSGSSRAAFVWEWDFDNDGIFDAMVNTPTTQHTFTAPYTGEVGLRVSGIGLSSPVVTAPVAIAFRFDLDRDGDVDTNDLNIVLANRGVAAAASTCGVVCDFDGDGTITAVDARLLVNQCTRTGCATQ